MFFVPSPDATDPPSLETDHCLTPKIKPLSPIEPKTKLQLTNMTYITENSKDNDDTPIS